MKQRGMEISPPLDQHPIGGRPASPPQEKKGGGLPGPEFPHFAGRILHPPSAGSLVISKDSEGDSQGSEPKLQNVQREVKNDPHVDSSASLETKVSGPRPAFRGIPCDCQRPRTGFPGDPPVGIVRIPWNIQTE